jgi:hypothetical protein
MKFKKTAILAVAVILALNAGCINFIPGFAGVTYPKIVPDPSGSMPEPRAYHFLFQDYEITIDSLPIESAVYAGARNAEKSARIFDENIGEDEWLSGIYTSMISDPAQDPFYENLLSAFREIREDRLLDDDEYLELITVFVQSINYENLDLTNPKYPIETYVDGRGDCDDKSMLLAGLLAREGYRVSLLYFDPELHMGVGIDCGDEGYKNTGYGYIETTNVTLVGIPPSVLQGNTGLSSDPLVIPIGNGTRNYSRCNETRAIWDKLKETETVLIQSESGIKALESRLQEESETLELQRSTLDAHLTEGNLLAYNRLVPPYNAAVLTYNALLDDFREKSDHYNTLAELHNYILTHQYDRKGTFELLFG